MIHDYVTICSAEEYSMGKNEDLFVPMEPSTGIQA